MRGLAYLGTPYTRYFAGLEAAHREACRAAAHLIRHGLIVYCPIAHSHPIAEAGRLDPRDHGLWLPQDAPIMEAADRLIVCEMQGWRDSFGLAHEIAWFRARRRPVLWMPWPQAGGLALRDAPGATP